MTRACGFNNLADKIFVGITPKETRVAPARHLHLHEVE
jgi:hypothetical protein